ncbi:DUF234 domain-containing protein [uncultured Campylobacter sp.]|uniref:DUF234 domain-containing protein n=1 Tax=uncultured Campylobacter sp. TaxID=218934 RepID=UPI00261A06AA|nr:DUF234 domain-containing protein [uncultured Campylobacter sp.]
MQIEKSKEEKPKPKRKNEKLKRELRRYIVHDKVHFRSNFARFWFRFVEPNLELLKAGKFELVLDMIRDDFDNYASLAFELLSAELLKKSLSIKGEISSFWTNHEEIDLFWQDSSGNIGVAEAKYKDRKVCKNILTLLEKKCHKIGLTPQTYALFSRSGFSKELLKQREDVLLFDIEDFRLLLN